MAEQTQKIEQQITDEASASAEQIVQDIQAKEQNGYDGFSGEKVKLIPTPNFTEAKSVGTLLPINMANETVTNLSQLAKQFNFIDFIKEKLNYASRVKVVQAFSSEQIDALVLAITSFEQGNGFILGDMAGIGKGRVCAGVMRYSYTNGFIPVFLSQKPYLFNDIYRDLMNIGGIGADKKGTIVLPKPFIMHNEGVIIDKKTLKPIQTIQDIKKIDSMGQTIYKFVDNNKEFSINEICKDITEMIDKTKKVSLPKDFNSVMLPYSVISQSKTTIRRNFLSAIAPNSIFIFDESHNAASSKEDSNILKYCLPLIAASKSVLFSSATYAKNPNVFNLYIVKTALRTAVPSLENITNALKVGGENVSEYIASGLVKEGQMIRRERSFLDCEKITEYVGTERSITDDEEIYNQLPDDKQREFYNEAIQYFKELRDFAKGDLANAAIRSAIDRKLSDLKIGLADMLEYDRILNMDVRDPNYTQEKTKFINSNKKKFILQDYTKDNISRYKATFRENLFLAVKAKFSADKVIECLNKPVNYKNVDGSTHYTPQKPIIAIANTGEAVFNELRLQDGDIIQNDFSEYLRAIYNKIFNGTVTLRQVDANIFESVTTLKNSGIDYDLFTTDFEVVDSDFSDGGTKIRDIEDRLKSYQSELPFSVIDYLRDRIESTERDSVYFVDQNKTTALYGKASTMYYRFAEGTSRKYMLRKVKGTINDFEFVKNDRIKSTSAIFQAFNDGAVDVLLINVVASTGGSAQSSPEEGVDTRPRNMFVIQFELDINVEIQKRGRINRTGQLNQPTYTYIITQIPVEKRKYLMFRKKLRKLDANTSADQTASAKNSEMNDSKGNPIEDIFNAYGFEVFSNQFINDPQYADYLDIYGATNFRSKASVGNAEKNEINVNHFDAFVRELELYPTSIQETFFDVMNLKYIAEKERLTILDEWQEELETKNLKASLKQRVVVQLNSGTTVFSKPLFLSDYYTFENKKMWSKDRMEQKVAELSKWNSTPVAPLEFHSLFLDDYKKESDNARKNLEISINAKMPDRKDFADDEEFDKEMDIFNYRKNAKLLGLKDSHNLMLDLIRFYKPQTPVYFKGNLGYFVGYKLLDNGTKFKYTEGSIEFIFCFLSEYPVVHFKSTNLDNGVPIVVNIKSVTQFLMNDVARQTIIDWKPNLYNRIVRRFLDGNILSGIVEASRRKAIGEIQNYYLLRFTNFQGSIQTGIELKYEKQLPATAKIDVSKQPLTVAADNPKLLDYLKDYPLSIGNKRLDTQQIQQVFPIWNAESDKSIDRAVCILVREVNNVKNYYVGIFQRYLIQTDKNKVTKEIDVTKNPITGKISHPSLWNDIYHDDLFLNKYKNNFLQQAPIKKEIDYAYMQWVEVDKYGKSLIRTKYNNFPTYIKMLVFDANDTTEISKFFSELYKKYDVSFNFKSEVEELLQVSEQGDVALEELKKKVSYKAFEDGEYEYRFIKNVPENIITSIPEVLSRTYNGQYGGVIVKQPITPERLVSYGLKPFNLPSNVMIDVALGVLNEQDKADFIDKLQKKSETDSPEKIGYFVEEYFGERSVSTNPYFFGNLTPDEFGQIFKDYGENKELSTIKSETERVSAPPKSNITFDDAERFIIKLWSLI